MNLDSLLEVVNCNLIEGNSRPLSSPEVIILRGVWQYQTYTQIALEEGYSSGYFTNVVAPELWKRLSQLTGQHITKKNCRKLLEGYAEAQQNRPVTLVETSDNAPRVEHQGNSGVVRYPSGSVPLDSPHYMERSPVETQAYDEIQKPGALIRIKAPQEMGKTSLLLRILDRANALGYRTVSLNVQQVDESILQDLNRFLRWLCANVTRQLKLTSKLDDYWDEDIGGKISCTLYFQDYLLEDVKEPFVLALDEVNQLFEHPQVAKDVLPLLRSWYEEAKRLPIWRKLRLVVVHSTEIYVPLNLKQSPFNVGLPLQLECFNPDQIEQLAQQYGLNWQNDEAQQLMTLVGGHPALVNIALYHLSCNEITLEQLLETANQTTGIYHSHLQRHRARLEEQPELRLSLDAITAAAEPVSLEPMITYQLYSMGLIKQVGDKVMPSCELYRSSFAH
ncbi:MAG: AAA-like domain-containing protein [Cyanobacteria bacterium P01_F01_bin.150]